MNIPARRAQLAKLKLEEKGWHYITEDAQRQTEKELKLELASAHVLFAKRVTAIARNGDDIIFVVDDSIYPYAIVHLTYAQHPERAPWPDTTLYHSAHEMLKRFWKDMA